ncbi:MAG: hypothetical protein ACYDCW_15605 [Acidithiobacillus ferrivorans]
MGIIDGKFSKRKIGLLSYLNNEENQSLYEYEKLKQRKQFLQDEVQQRQHQIASMPQLPKPPQIDGNVSAFACCAIAIMKITALAIIAL